MSFVVGLYLTFWVVTEFSRIQHTAHIVYNIHTLSLGNAFSSSSKYI
jgi:hypothetical protein